MSADPKDDLKSPPVEESPSLTVDTTLVAEQGRKRGRKTGATSPVVDAVLAAALAQAAQLAARQGLYGLSGLLTSSLQPRSDITTPLPTIAQVQAAAQKALVDQPPWIHWSKSDMAPQLKCDTNKLQIHGNWRGYRMARASVGCSSGSYYWEAWMQPGPTAHEIVQQLPPNARLGPNLQRQLQAALEWEEEQGKKNSEEKKIESKKDEEEEVDDDDETRGKKRKLQDDNATSSRPQVGGHVRVGWSMRTGDLQAPVGYDKWSYGIRDIGGSILHQSQRQDVWGGEGFGQGDMIGCAVCLEEDNHIRFFKNGNCMGQFVIRKGKRSGGEAFTNLEAGTYYPAVSTYMGGTVRANFGPHFVCPPRKLPAGLKLNPLTDLCPPPLSPEEALAKLQPAVKLFRKADHQQAFKDAVETEAAVLCEAYNKFMKEHVSNIREARLERGFSVQDLPE